MKKIILFLGVSVFTLTGCVDLLQEPLNTLTPENLTYDEPNLKAVTEGLYVDLWGNNYGFNVRPQILGLGADDIISGSPDKRHTQVDYLNVTEGRHDSDSETEWQNMFNLVRSANTMIQAVPPSTVLNEEIKNKYLGEAYFMRAFAYFQLARFYGGVPLFTDPQCVEDIYGKKGKAIQRAPIADVYDLMIVPDLIKAEQLLPDIPRTGNNSKVCTWAAKACLADVYLTMAGWPLKRQDFYKKAQYKCSEIIKRDKYSLVEKYPDLWKEEGKSSDTEHIFALNHSTEMYSNYGISYFAKEEMGGAWSDYLADSTFYRRFPDDERKAFNFSTSVKVPGRPAIDFTKWSERSPAIAKYRDYGVTSPQTLGITPVYRYAEVLLMYAEAQNKADGAPNDSAYTAINKVRYRAMEAPNDLTPGLSGSAFDKAVFDEYGWEFFAEFKRWFHLVRREQVWEANQFNPHIKKSLAERGITADNRNIYLITIPSTEVAEYGLTQNPR